MIGSDASGMRYLSLDLPFIEKADQVKCRDPRLQTIMNVFPNSWAQAFRNYPYITSNSQSKVEKPAMQHA